MEVFQGTGICSTYLDPGGVAQREGALLHQIREADVAEERISTAMETVAGGRAPPLYPKPLEEEKRALSGEKGDDDKAGPCWL